ncbi:hypothetical protein LCGC14_0657440 [marine sediment metagenome]|uniref:Uncharacterized protein n=1 Tax=marine sediment metagenome TaxID=412755 RepID=A0A0F9TG87_9ZZZZ
MKVTFINMPVRTHARPNNIPLGIYCVGAALQRSCAVSMTYIDLNLHRPDDEEELSSLLQCGMDADLFLLSGLITTLAWQRRITEVIRRQRADVPIVSGGGLATDVGESLVHWTGIDAACVGEGELIIQDIVSDAAAGQLKKVYGPVILRELETGAIEWCDVVGLDTYVLHPVWGRVAANSSYVPFSAERSVNLITSRGCSRSCRFCCRSALGGRSYRGRNPDAVAREVEKLVTWLDLDFVGFVDDNFAATPRRLVELCEVLSSIRQRHNFTWGCHARFDELDDPARLTLMAESGCVYIGFGGESADPDILAAMNKGNDPEQMARVISCCRKVGIHPNVTWIAGWPGETEQQLKRTIRFILEHVPENKRLFVATAYPNTALYTDVLPQILAQFESVEDYVLMLEDATKPVMNYSAIPDKRYYELMQYIQLGKLEELIP